jgi:Raf kinase inhibitor-like YbhB/YbcL family protein
MSIRYSILATAIALMAMCGVQGASAQGGFILSSTGFKDGERLPTKFAASSKSNPNCVGENISPALAWANPPEGTKSFALLVVDVDARPPVGFVHLVAYGIAPSVSGFAEGALSIPGNKYVGGQNTPKLAGYFGPCAPSGPPHHYVFSLIATDLEPAALKEGMTREELVKALEGHAKGISSLVGTFSKP